MSTTNQIHNESNTTNGRSGNGENTRQTAREDARPPIPAQLVVPAMEGERHREPRSPGKEPGSPAGSVDWRAQDAKVRECLRIEHYSMIYTHGMNKGPMGVVSPVDTL